MSKRQAFSWVAALFLLLGGKATDGAWMSKAFMQPAPQIAFRAGGFHHALAERLLFSGEEGAEEGAEEQEDTRSTGQSLPLWLEMKLRGQCQLLFAQALRSNAPKLLFLLHCDFRC